MLTISVRFVRQWQFDAPRTSPAFTHSEVVSVDSSYLVGVGAPVVTDAHLCVHPRLSARLSVFWVDFELIRVHCVIFS